MRASQGQLNSCLQANTSFNIPIYQRRYNWQKKHCKQLFDDIQKAGDSEKNRIHFIGAITLLDEPNPVFKTVRRYQIIDGQQRLTTIMLILRALKESLPDSGASVTEDQINQLLFNLTAEEGDRFKLTLTDEDDFTFREILEDGKSDVKNKLTENYNYFRTLITKSNDLDTIWRGINMLQLVEIKIEKEDDAQAIFESMNSTGLDLSQTDLIQNYILMPLTADEQKKIYKEYWNPMEKKFTDEDDSLFNEFFTDYLMMKNGGFIPKNNIYEYFKRYNKENNLDIKKEIKNIWNYSTYYEYLVGIREHPDPKLKKIIRYPHDQGVSVARPLLLKVIADIGKSLTVEKAAEIFLLVDSFLLRCSVCGTSKATNKMFPMLIPKLGSKDYLKDLERLLMEKSGNLRFPRDIMFMDALRQLPLYTHKRKLAKYMLDRLELSLDEQEQIDTAELEIEHIMPMTLNEDWKGDLGGEWEDIHEKYVQRIGNLTLTGRNQELSNKSFLDKLPTYEKSNVNLSKKLKNLKKWDKAEIENRTDDIVKLSIDLWPCPEGYVPVAEDECDEDEYLDGKSSSELWHLTKDALRESFDGMIFKMTCVYGAFKARRNSKEIGVCSLEALSKKIRITYNVKTNDGIIEKSDFVEDVSSVGHYTPGDLRSDIKSEDDIKKAVELVRKVWAIKTG